MTPRDHYAAGALQGLLAEAAGSQPWDSQSPALVSLAADIADLMAAEACKRWGHLGTFGSCGRCGVDLGQRPPPPPVRVP